MSKNKKPKPQHSPASNDAAVSRQGAAEAARRRNKKESQFPWLASIAVLLAAVVGTVFLTSSPAPPAPRRDSARAGGMFQSRRDAPQDEAFSPQDRASQCASWVKDGECSNNEEFMSEKCPGSCAAASKKAKVKRGSPPPPSGPQDANANCGPWASAGECDNNPDYMLKECPHACANGGDDQAGGAALQDIHQDCAAWVSDGECYRNPAFMLQQCKASCSKFAQENDNILQDTSETCVNFALRGGCDTDAKKATTTCRASCHIKRICANHTAEVPCSRALRCEAIGDHKSDCPRRAAEGKCASDPTRMLKECLKSCSELDLDGMMRFHMPHERTRLSRLIDLPGPQPRVAGFYSTPPQARNTDLTSLSLCEHGAGSGFSQRMGRYRQSQRWRDRHGRYHWDKWDFSPLRPRTPRVPHLFRRVPADATDAVAAGGSSHDVVVQQISFSPRIRYLHHLLSPEECDHVVKLAQPLFSRSPVRGSVTRVRTSTTAMLGGRHDDAVVSRIRRRIARFSGYDVDMIEPLQVVRYERGQKYEGHHDFFDVCDLEDKVHNGRRQITFLIYLADMPEGEDGGGTRFPDLNLEVMPEKGSAIVFNDCFDNGEEDGRSLHAGQPPLNPATVKYAINGWIRSRPVYSKMGGGSLF